MNSNNTKLKLQLNDIIERLENRTLKLDSEEDYAVVEEMLTILEER